MEKAKRLRQTWKVGVGLLLALALLLGPAGQYLPEEWGWQTAYAETEPEANPPEEGGDASEEQPAEQEEAEPGEEESEPEQEEQADPPPDAGNSEEPSSPEAAALDAQEEERDVDQLIYDILVEAITNHEQHGSRIPVDFSSYRISHEYKDRFSPMMARVRNNNPQFFYLGNGFGHPGTIWINSEGYLGLAYVELTGDAATRIQMIADYNMEKARLLNTYLPPAQRAGMSKTEMALALFTAIKLHTTYNIGAYVLTQQSAYGAIVERSAVCQGFMLAYMDLLREVGVNSVAVVTQYNDPYILGHAWNLVETEYGWYHVDSTNVSDGQIPTIATYNNFMKSGTHYILYPEYVPDYAWLPDAESVSHPNEAFWSGTNNLFHHDGAWYFTNAGSAGKYAFKQTPYGTQRQENHISDNCGNLIRVGNRLFFYQYNSANSTDKTGQLTAYNMETGQTACVRGTPAEGYYPQNLWNDNYQTTLGYTQRPLSGVEETTLQIYTINEADFIFRANLQVGTNLAAGGSVTASHSGEVEQGTQVTLTATPNLRYRFSYWEITGIGGKYYYTATASFVMPAGDVTATAIFMERTDLRELILTCSPAEGGTIQSSLGEGWVPRGAGTLTAVPAPGYRFARWETVGINRFEYDHNDPVLNFDLHGKFTATAVFVPESAGYYALNVTASPPEGGTVRQGPDRAPCEEEMGEGNKVYLYAKPNPGYRFIGWAGTSVGGGAGQLVGEYVSYFNMPAANVTIIAKFEPIQYTLTTPCSPTEGGVVTSSHGGQASAGAQVTLTAAPNAQYRFMRWDVEGISGVDTSSATLAFTMPAGDVSATAIFESTAYSFSIVASPPQGGLVFNHSGSRVEAGAPISVSAMANPGYIFVGYRSDQVREYSHFPHPATSYLHNYMPAENTVITAVFELREQPEETYSVMGLDYQIGPLTRAVSIYTLHNGSQQIRCMGHAQADALPGAAVSLKVELPMNYRFERWEIYGVTNVNIFSPILQFVMPAGHVMAIAVFVKV